MNEKKEIEFMPIYGNKIEESKRNIPKEEMKRRRKKGLVNIKLLVLVAAMGMGGVKVGMSIEEYLNTQDRIRNEKEAEEQAQMAYYNAYSRYQKQARQIVEAAMIDVSLSRPNAPYNWDYLIAKNELEKIIDEQNLSENDITELIFTVRDYISTNYKSQASFECTSAMVKSYCGLTIDEYLKAHELPEDREAADNYIRDLINVRKGYQFDNLEESINHGRN